MGEFLCPWDTIEVLEARAGDPRFPACWRSFVLACGEFVLPDLPAEAREWAECATGFDRGERTADDLSTLSSTAWTFYRNRIDSDPVPVQSGLLIIMTGLGIGFDAGRWCEGAWHFLNCCEEAGLSHEVLAGLLQFHFGSLLPCAGRA
jgi:hypothetical protein